MENDPKPIFRFYKTPFLVLTLSLCAGILLGFEFPKWHELILFCGSLLILITLIFYIKNWLNGIFLFGFIIFGFLLTGCLLVQNRIGQESQVLEESYQSGDLLMVKLSDIGSSDKEWKKMTGDIQSVYTKRTILSTHTPVVLFINSENFGCETGDLILVSSDLLKIENAGNPGEFDAENYWSKKGFKYMMFVGEDQYKIIEHEEVSWFTEKLSSLRNYLRSSLEENLKGKELAIALALILGDKSLLDSEITTSFTNTGAMHVLAVSGLHIGIIMQILMFFLSKFSKLLSRKNAVIIVVIIMWIYALITGLSPSVARAVFMFSVLAFAQLTGKNHNSINSLFFTAFALMLYDPLTLYDIGFQLSFLAMLGIFLFYRQIEQVIFIENKWLRKIWQGTAIGFAAQLMTTPLSLYYFHQFPNYFVLTNIGLMASSGLILGLGLFMFSISWWTWFARIGGVVLTFIIYLSLAFIEWVEVLPGAVAYGFEVSIWLVFILAWLILYLFLLAKNRKQIIISLSIGMILLSFIVFKRYENNTVNELCVFNARQVIVTVRKNDQLFCFYKAKKRDEQKVKFIVAGYLKLHPAKVHYYPLNERNWSIRSSSLILSTKSNNGSILFSLNGKNYSILLSEYSQQYDENSITIGMPWIDFTVDHSLQNGAFIKAI